MGNLFGQDSFLTNFLTRIDGSEFSLGNWLRSHYHNWNVNCRVILLR